MDLSSIPAQAAGLFAMICLVSWPLFKTRSSILLVQLGIGLGFAAHFALLGVWAASAVSALGATQTVAAYFAGQGRAAERTGYILIVAMIAAGFYFWSGPSTALAVAGMVLVSLGRMQLDQTALRILLMAGSAIWAAHDFSIGSHIAFTADVLSFAMGAVMLFKTWPGLRDTRLFHRAQPA
jgi:uncharacterized membrane protein